MRYLSVCSGIEAATMAWKTLGWRAAAFAEVDPFCCAVLKHHYPEVENLGDINAITEDQIAAIGPIDVLVGGTPCQGFSVAGRRGGLADPRSNLALRFCELAALCRPRWIVWENVPGVYSMWTSKTKPPRANQKGKVWEGTETSDFGCFVDALVQRGYGVCWRVLDAQYAGLAQRRKRVFLVGHLGDWRPAAAVLLDRYSLQGHHAPRREAGEVVTGSLASRTSCCGGLGTDFDCDGGLVANAIRHKTHPTSRAGENELIVGTLPSSDGGVSSGMHPVVAAPPLAFSANAKGGAGRIDGESETFVATIAGTLGANHGNIKAEQAWGGQLAVAYRTSGNCGTDQNQNIIQQPHGVRRLTPVECCRLQGFSDTYLDILYRGKPAKDGPKYKALGNSMAVPCMRWIGERIELVEKLRTSLNSQEELLCWISRERSQSLARAAGPAMREERLRWFESHDSFADPICRKNCLDVCIAHNSTVEAFHNPSHGTDILGTP